MEGVRKSLCDSAEVSTRVEKQLLPGQRGKDTWNKPLTQ
jgi:hypothetical protein